METTLISAFKILLAFLGGVVIGVDRERCGKPTGARTLMLISVGSAMLSDISIQLPNLIGTQGRMGGDPARLMAQIVVGIGFVGAGVIIKGHRDYVVGVTTAATIWVTACYGIAIGTGFYIPALLTLVCVLLLGPLAEVLYKLGLKISFYRLVIHPKFFAATKSILKDRNIPFDILHSKEKEISLKLYSSARKNQGLDDILHARKVKFSLENYTED